MKYKRRSSALLKVLILQSLSKGFQQNELFLFVSILKVCQVIFNYSCFRVDNNHLLLLMIHVFRENEEQLFKVKTIFLFCLGFLFFMKEVFGEMSMYGPSICLMAQL